MIGIICFLSTRYAQFANKYLDILEKNNIQYEFIFWNREGDYKGDKENWISFNEKVNSFQPFYKKISSFIKYSIFMRKKIKEKKYDKLIVLISQTAIPLADILLFKYKKRYIFDYRDVTYENIKPYRWLINKIVKNSCFTAISSNGFLKYLDEDNEYSISHNIRKCELKSIKKSYSNKIRVVYWGMVRQLEFNFKICDLFANDNRFELYYHGAGYHEQLKKYCQKNNYSNIYITGAYQLKEIDEFVKDTDIVLNLYENDKQQKPAMTVKFYDSIIYGRPMIVNSGSYMSELVNKYNLGFVVDIKSDSFLNELYIKYTNNDFCVYQNNRFILIDKIKDDDENFKKKVLKYLL